jgi:Fe-S oxidoreductase
MRPPSLVEDARRELVNLGFITEKQARMGERVRHSGNSLGEFSERLGWLSEQPRKTADFVYFVGCLDSYRYPETAARTFQILKPFGTTVLSKEMCCGSPLLCSGLDASESISSNLEQIRKVGADTVITGCAGCFTTLNGYPGDLRVLSVPEFLAEHLGELDLRPLEITVAYHDPCHLGRIYKIYDAPRQVIKAICHLEEMAAVRESSRCCGGGGGVRASYSELSLKLARRRLEDVPEGVDYVVTTCPLCVRNLRDAGGRAIDLVELVGMAMDGILIQ